MYLGHYAVALAAKRASPTVSLGTLFAASQLMDLLWPLFVLTGVEKVTVDPLKTVVSPLDFVYYPFTHSLLAVLLWATLFASLYRMVSGSRTAALTLWFLVLSHWVLDFLAHVPDLPLYPGGGILVGLGLWNSLEGTLVLELGLFLAGLILYLSVTRPANRWGTYTLMALVSFLLVTYAVSVFGPPPPGARGVALSALLLWAVIPWGYWIDRNRHASVDAPMRRGKLKYRGRKP